MVQNIISHPIPVSGITNHTLPGLVTYSDLKSLVVYGIHEPLIYFPIMADVFAQLERGNVSVLVGMSEKLYLDPNDGDGGVIIRCADSYRDNKLTTIEDWGTYIDFTVSSSKYIGDIFPIWARTILCRLLRPQLPNGLMIQGRISFSIAVSIRFHFKYEAVFL